jgi:hypothetical protein
MRNAKPGDNNVRCLFVVLSIGTLPAWQNWPSNFGGSAIARKLAEHPARRKSRAIRVERLERGSEPSGFGGCDSLLLRHIPTVEHLDVLRGHLDRRDRTLPVKVLDESRVGLAAGRQLPPLPLELPVPVVQYLHALWR